MIELLENVNIIIIFIVFGVSLFILSKAADLLVDNAVELSNIWAMPEIIIGATIVSLGTTLPELAASVTSALQGNSGFALGNAVGSIITNTSLIIGISALFGKIPVDKKSSQKLTLLIIAVFLLIIPTFPYKIMDGIGRIPRCMGFIFLIMIPLYIYFLVHQEKKNKKLNEEKELLTEKSKKRVAFIISKIFLCGVIIALSASALVGSAEVLAEKIGIPDVIIASTLVAFGTSVPELSTCISAAKSKHGGLALGNVMGANILNILMVVGASVALTPGGIKISQEFYQIQFLVLGLVLVTFGIFAYNSKINKISKREGMILILIYMIFVGANLASTL
jgi:cation:H+ antiporter